ncbi:MAG TPA: hypothetical protein DIC52_21830 [Candidatus Latescibacteria bacterium]|nr:hypothetical protein [Candidatus Latescibacterota bacterium]
MAAAVEEGTFRRDLYYRLTGFVLRVPPLRQRREEIPHLVFHALDNDDRLDGGKLELTQDGMDRLQAYSWPGNVRQLLHEVGRRRRGWPDRDLPSVVGGRRGAGSSGEGEATL